ncbi:MAG: hypothetical protein HY706_18335 [Candidatus Hydrogenedentes bacterium]|nr:hypothetical protein [Candidatus Hydrogenedentota bacterium]
MWKIEIATFLSLVLLVPYFGWGVYTLRLRFRFHEELNPVVETTTLACLFVFYVFELALLSVWLEDNPVFLIFSVLGLVVSGAALYGSMAISLLSRVIVEMMMPSGHNSVAEPRYGPAEALERQGDFDGAVQEYMVIARIFPRDPTTAIRIGDNLMKLGRPQDAAPWFERGLANLNSPEKSLVVTNRLCEIYHRHLNRGDSATRVLQNYLEKFPTAEYAGTIRDRLRQLTGASQTTSVV